MNILNVVSISTLFILAIVFSGCISPAVDVKKEIVVFGSPLCTANCTNGGVTINMNSGTDVEAQVDQDVKDVIDATIPLR